jgi:putative PIN family toxin of toxin-antitoxin system
VRIVFDTSSLITALRSGHGAAAEVLRLVLLEKVVILMDYKIPSEYRDVALRPEHLSASGRTAESVLALIEGIEGVAESILVVRKPRPLSPHPNDDMILDVAINGRANALVTQNTKHFAAAALRYGINVFTPAELLGTLKKRGKHGE